jgi:hypothetical protein
MQAQQYTIHKIRQNPPALSKMYLCKTTSVQSKSKTNSHLPYPKCTYTEPAVFNSKTTPNSNLHFPIYIYTGPALFNPKTTKNPHLHSPQIYLYITSSIQSKNYATIPPALSKVHL